MTAVFLISMVILLNLTLSQELPSKFENYKLQISDNKILLILQDKTIELYFNVENVKPAPIFHKRSCKRCEPIKYCECGTNWCIIDQIIGTNIHNCNKKKRGIIHLIGSVAKKGWNAISNVEQKVQNTISEVGSQVTNTVSNVVSNAGKHVTNAISSVFHFIGL